MSRGRVVKTGTTSQPYASRMTASNFDDGKTLITQLSLFNLTKFKPTIPTFIDSTNITMTSPNLGESTFTAFRFRDYRLGRDGFYYKFYDKKKSWSEAQTVCEEDGGSLAVIWNATTNDVAREFMVDEGWIGLTDQLKEGEWLTPDNQTLHYSHWGWSTFTFTREPNNWGPSGEDCAVQRIDGKWNDFGCHHGRYFLCQTSRGNSRCIYYKYTKTSSRGKQSLASGNDKQKSKNMSKC